MKIVVTQKFLDGPDCYQEGEVRILDEDKAAYFIDNGWARDLESDAEVQESPHDTVDLDVHNIDQEAF